MPSTREIRQRIKSVNNIAKITGAMQLIAASKMRRAQQQVLASREFSDYLFKLMNSVSVNAPERAKQIFSLLEERPVNKSLVVLITPNRGLAGALVGNVLREALHQLDKLQEKQVKIVTIGRKGERFVVRSRWDLQASFDLGDAPTEEAVNSVSGYLIKQFQSREFDEVSLVYSRFINTAVQKPESLRLLPIKIAEGGEVAGQQPDFIYEPNIYKILANLLPKYVSTQIYQAILEASASEHSARMVAMRNATDNASELNDSLTLEYNKARQEYITSELLDIVGGAGALA